MQGALQASVNVGFYQSASSMNALEQWQRQVSENISASSVAGYKKSDVAFAAIGEGVLPTSTASNSSGLAVGHLPSAHESTDFTQGPVRSTQNPLDFSIEGEGFFSIQLQNSQIQYTRNGQFHLNAESTLVDAHGNQVLGEGGTPITVDPTAGPLTVSPIGQLQQGNDTLGAFEITAFDSPQNLLRAGGGFLISDDQDPQLRLVENPAVSQGYIEDANNKPVSEMVNLIEISRAFEANQKVIQAYEERSSRAIEALGATR